MILEDAARLKALAAEVIVLRRSQQHGQSLAHRRQLVDALLTRIEKCVGLRCGPLGTTRRGTVIISALRGGPRQDQRMALRA